jgi:hypothetical protein
MECSAGIAHSIYCADPWMQSLKARFGQTLRNFGMFGVPGDWAGTTVFYLWTEATKLAIWALDAIPMRINTIVQST